MSLAALWLISLCLLITKVISQAGVYGIGGYEINENDDVIEASLVKYDRNDGSTKILYKSEFNMTSNSKSCFDNKYNIWYFLVEDFSTTQPYLARYNLQTTERLNSIPLSSYFNWITNIDCIGDPNTGDIYLFGNTYRFSKNTTMLLQLVTDGPDTNYSYTINIIRDYSDDDNIDMTTFPFAGVSPIFDSKRNMAWFNMVNGTELAPPYNTIAGLMVYVDIKTGDIKRQIPPWDANLSNSSFPGERTCIYDYKLDRIIGLDWSVFVNISANESDSIWSLKYSDPVYPNNITKKFDGFMDYCPFFIHSSSIDYEHDILYIVAAKPRGKPYGFDKCLYDAFYTPQFHLLGININNGKIVTQPQIEKTYLINWDPVLEIIYWDGQ